MSGRRGRDLDRPGSRGTEPGSVRQRLGYSGAQIGKVETGERAPSQDFAQGCDRALPEAGGLFARIYQLARRWDGGYPSWFTEWVESERRAVSLHTREPLLMPGLLQTPEYARALFKAWRSADSDDELDQLVAARADRYKITIQIVPTGTRAHVGLLGALLLFSAASWGAFITGLKNRQPS